MIFTVLVIFLSVFVLLSIFKKKRGCGKKLSGYVPPIRCGQTKVLCKLCKEIEGCKNNDK